MAKMKSSGRQPNSSFSVKVSTSNETRMPVKSRIPIKSAKSSGTVKSNVPVSARTTTIKSTQPLSKVKKENLNKQDKIVAAGKANTSSNLPEYRQTSAHVDDLDEGGDSWSDTDLSLATFSGSENDYDFDQKAVYKNKDGKNYSSTRYIERFKYGDTANKEEKVRERVLDSQDFWWVGEIPEPVSSIVVQSTPLRDEPVARMSHRRKVSPLKSDNNTSGYEDKWRLKKSSARADTTEEGENERIRELEERLKLLQKQVDNLHESPDKHADNMTRCATLGSTLLSDPGSDNCISVVHEPSYRPLFTKGKRSETLPHKLDDGDILAEWRAKRRMEEMKKVTHRTQQSTDTFNERRTLSNEKYSDPSPTLYDFDLPLAEHQRVQHSHKNNHHLRDAEIQTDVECESTATQTNLLKIKPSIQKAAEVSAKSVKPRLRSKSSHTGKEYDKIHDGNRNRKLCHCCSHCERGNSANRICSDDYCSGRTHNDGYRASLTPNDGYSSSRMHSDSDRINSSDKLLHDDCERTPVRLEKSERKKTSAGSCSGSQFNTNYKSDHRTRDDGNNIQPQLDDNVRHRGKQYESSSIINAKVQSSQNEYESSSIINAKVQSSQNEPNRSKYHSERLRVNTSESHIPVTSNESPIRSRGNVKEIDGSLTAVTSTSFMDSSITEYSSFASKGEPGPTNWSKSSEREAPGPNDWSKSSVRSVTGANDWGKSSERDAPEANERSKTSERGALRSYDWSMNSEKEDPGSAELRESSHGDPQAQSSLLYGVTDQVVTEQLLTDNSVSLTASNMLNTVSSDCDINHQEPTGSASSEHRVDQEDPNSTNIAIDIEEISDGEEFSEDVILKELRQRRAQYMTLLKKIGDVVQ